MKCTGTKRFKAVLLLIALFGGLIDCSKSEKEPEPEVPVQAVSAKQSSIEEVINADAVLYPLKQAAITPKVTAPVKEFYVNRASKVKQGQLLAVLENRDLAAATIENKGGFEQAEAAYTTTTKASLPEEMQKAELDVTNTKQALDAEQKLYESRQNLFDQGALPRKDLDQSHVSYTQAKANYDLAVKHLEALQAVGKHQEVKAATGNLNAAKGKYLSAQAQFSYSEIRSPINGVVTDRPYYVGEMVTAGTPLLTIMDASSVIARAHIPQEQAALLKVGDAANISAPGLDAEAPGRVTIVSPATDPNSTTVEVWVEVPNPSGNLRPGTSVRVSMVARKAPDALTVPISALLTSPDGKTTVMVLGKDGRAHQQQVQVGIRNSGEAQVTTGLKPGELVIIEGAYGLPDNTKVRIENGGGEDKEGGSSTSQERGQGS